MLAQPANRPRVWLAPARASRGQIAALARCGAEPRLRPAARDAVALRGEKSPRTGSRRQWAAKARFGARRAGLLAGKTQRAAATVASPQKPGTPVPHRLWRRQPPSTVLVPQQTPCLQQARTPSSLASPPGKGPAGKGSKDGFPWQPACRKRQSDRPRPVVTGRFARAFCWRCACVIWSGNCWRKLSARRDFC